MSLSNSHRQESQKTNSVKKMLYPYYRKAIAQRTALSQKVNIHYGALRNKKSFRSVETYCKFVGYGSSGHSLIGALLDAHPNMIIPDSIEGLRFLLLGYSREQIFQAILAKSQANAKAGVMKPGRRGNYSYAVSGQWQGRFDKLQVIGDAQVSGQWQGRFDKLHAKGSLRRFVKEPNLLDRLQETVKAKLKFVDVLRNPYDNITTRSIKAKITLDEEMDQYFLYCETLDEFRKHIDSSDLLFVRHEAFVDNPTACLREICTFLGVEASEEYLQACASIVYKSPVKSRFDSDWNQGRREQLQSTIQKYDFLKGYSYEE